MTKRDRVRNAIEDYYNGDFVWDYESEKLLDRILKICEPDREMMAKTVKVKAKTSEVLGAELCFSIADEIIKRWRKE